MMRTNLLPPLQTHSLSEMKAKLHCCNSSKWPLPCSHDYWLSLTLSPCLPLFLSLPSLPLEHHFKHVGTIDPRQLKSCFWSVFCVVFKPNNDRKLTVSVTESYLLIRCRFFRLKSTFLYGFLYLGNIVFLNKKRCCRWLRLKHETETYFGVTGRTRRDSHTLTVRLPKQRTEKPRVQHIQRQCDIILCSGCHYSTIYLHSK